MRSITLILFCFLCVGFIGCSEEQPKVLRIGDPAPAFETVDFKGIKVSLAQWHEHPVIIRFFYPDCKYCKADTAVFNEYYEKYHQNGLEIVYINTRPESSSLETFAGDLDIKFPIVVDTDGKLAALYRVQVVPQAIILKPDHTIAAAIMGGVSGDEMQQLLGGFLQ